MYKAKDISRDHLGAQDIYSFHLGKLHFYLKHHLLWVLQNMYFANIYFFYIYSCKQQAQHHLIIIIFNLAFIEQFYVSFQNRLAILPKRKPRILQGSWRPNTLLSSNLLILGRHTSQDTLLWQRRVQRSYMQTTIRAALVLASSRETSGTENALLLSWNNDLLKYLFQCHEVATTRVSLQPY